MSSGIAIRFLFYLPCFALGVLVKRNAIVRNFLWQQRVIFIFLSVLVYCLSLMGNKTSALSQLSYIILVSISALLIFLYADHYLKNIKFLPAVYVISYSSYCMYLFHRPIFIMTRLLFFPANELNQVLFLYLVSLPTIILFSWGVQKTYDYLTSMLDPKTSL